MMAKKKKKNQDFQKVKIKAGKKLPKHLNETKPEFKAKKIQIKSLPSSDGDFVKLLSSSSLNSNLKLVYLNKLNQQLAQKGDVQFSNSAEQIQVLCHYITDDDHRVRESAINGLKKCLLLLVPSAERGNNLAVSNKNISPVVTILLTFVHSGITHINEAIRKDAQKFFAFLLDKCDTSLHDHIRQMFLSKINSLWRNSLDVNYYNLLQRFISRSVAMENSSNNTDLNGNESCLPSQSETCAPTLHWSSSHCTIPLHTASSPGSRFAEMQHFQLTFQNKSLTNVRDKFVDVVKTMVLNDIKALLGRNKSRTLTVIEGQKAASALKIALQIDTLADELFQYWKNTAGCVPIVQIISSSGPRNATNKAEVKTAAHVQNDLDTTLNRYRKLAK